MRVTQRYLDTFETKKEVKDAILLRMTIIRNKVNMPEEVEKELMEEVEQFKTLLKDKFNEEFI